MNCFTTAWGEFELARFPEDPRERLRAWDAADEYLLRHLHDEAVPLDGAVTVLGDRWGALSTALAAAPAAEGAALTAVTDSYLASRAIAANLARNGADPAAVAVRSTQDAPPERIDVLLVRVPKSLALLEDQLHRLAPAVHPGTVVAGTGMVTEIHTSTLNLFERILGPTRTSLAVRKARLIHTAPAPEPVRPANPWPLRYRLPDGIGVLSGRQVANQAGVFCADRLDIGSRFFLQHLPEPAGAPRRIVDLGCGNGILGTAAALADPDAELLFVDESFQAVASAEETFRGNLGPGRRAEFLVGDALADVPSASADLVLLNPPFHSHQATTDAIAHRMFTGARRVLRPGGELRVVGNRHLGYHVRLRRLFGNCRTVAGSPKFTVLSATRR
ncbi:MULTISPECIES: methyltransferase [Kitasatospora]|uniref:Ribosomal RNA large subunit methyltransferase G n=1 Tax=Kitasatospora setae (strain ATCC 33774 / DSM 43861 / JCM 3304 / KCC A-0304 / NBRC 14216 / KM-6054) TaxID=452652 RepID=E4N802_KITSK|nr:MULTISPECIES: methyltransferase [Kitasatospora]BAJ27333.1 putative rRNA (guanine-N(2)-)-methyltransferase [Kitasatospora setae KM-6054]